MWLVQYNRRWLASSEVIRGVGIISALQFLLLTDDLYHQTAMSGWLLKCYQIFLEIIFSTFCVFFYIILAI